MVILEARPGESGRAVGTDTFNWNASNPSVLPDLQIALSAAIGNGSTAVCDDGPVVFGGVPAVAVDPGAFGQSQAVTNAINDFACRFNVRGSSGDACTINPLTTEERFVSTGTTTQFCGPIGSVLEFPIGDIMLTGRVLDIDGRPGPAGSIIVRVGD